MIGEGCPECEQSDCHGGCENPPDNRGRGLQSMLNHIRPKAQLARALGEVALLTLGVTEFNAWEVPDDEDEST